MDHTTCGKCGGSFDASRYPRCPNCLASSWHLLPGFVTSKHDPNTLPHAYPEYHSVISKEAVANLPQFTTEVALSGEWLLNKRNDKRVYFVAIPLSSIPGSAVPKGATMPVSALDGVLVAKADEPDAHIYAVDIAQVQAGISDGTYERGKQCSVDGCARLCLPANPTCETHTSAA